jgi:hypothetical protein
VLVALLGAADEEKLVAGGDPLVAVVAAEGEPEQSGLALGLPLAGRFLGRFFANAVTVSGLVAVSSGISFSSTA